MTVSYWAEASLDDDTDLYGPNVFNEGPFGTRGALGAVLYEFGILADRIRLERLCVFTVIVVSE